MFNDFLGVPISRDDIVIYPGRRFSSLYLNWGKVEAYDEKGLKIRKPGREAYGRTIKSRTTTVTETERVIVVPSSNYTPEMQQMVKGIDVEV